MNTKMISLAAAFAAIALAPLTAHADTAAPEIISVTAGDLDLTTQAGAKVMLKRIDEAATKACSPDKLNEMDAYNICRKSVMLDAVKVLDEPMVSLVYAETYPNKKAPMVFASR